MIRFATGGPCVPRAVGRCAGRRARLAAALGLAALGAGPLAPATLAVPRAVVDVSASPHVKFRPIEIDAARWTSGFWGERWELNRRVTVPTMKRVMELPDNSATFHNLRGAAGERQGEFHGNNWSDGDCYKWIEAAASVHALTREPELDRQMDEVIAVIAKAQAPDGYLSTQIQLTTKGRWTNLQHHELYNMGHLLTAACIHHRMTGKGNFLAIARKLADYLCTVFEPRPRELAHFGFNPSNIMGAAELYRTTGERRYLRLAGIFVSMRGSQPGGSDQQQARVPLRQESEAVGHAVTAAYLWCGAADVCAETGEAKYADVMERVWYNSMLSALGLEGKSYFYTNPLRRGAREVPLLNNDSATRWPDTTPASPLKCFCCPPSLARTIAQLHTYAYGLASDTVWIHLYGGSRLETRLPGGETIALSQTTEYPWSGRVTIRLEKAPATETALLKGVTVLETQGVLVPGGGANDRLYRPVASGQPETFALRLIPYYAWCNRGAGEMSVWLPAR